MLLKTVQNKSVFVIAELDESSESELIEESKIEEEEKQSNLEDRVEPEKQQDYSLDKSID